MIDYGPPIFLGQYLCCFCSLNLHFKNDTKITNITGLKFKVSLSSCRFHHSSSGGGVTHLHVLQGLPATQSCPWMPVCKSCCRKIGEPLLLHFWYCDISPKDRPIYRAEILRFLLESASADSRVGSPIFLRHDLQTGIHGQLCVARRPYSTCRRVTPPPLKLKLKLK